MKYLLFLCLIAVSFSCQAQFFKPIPKPGASLKATATAANPLVQNSIRPVVGVTALVSNSTVLAGGFGAGFQHNVWDEAAQSWNTQYSISAIGFLGSNGSNATFTAGLAFGFLNFISVGPGYDFTNKRFALLTGVQIHFN